MDITPIPGLTPELLATLRRRALVVLMGDLHTNSVVALGLPQFERDRGDLYTANAFQQWVYGVWQDTWRWIYQLKTGRYAGWPLVTVLNGELADDNYHSKFELISPNPADQMRHALAVLEPARQISDLVLVTRGTEAHSGRAAWMDEKLAEDMTNAIPSAPEKGIYSWWHFLGSFGGVRFDIAHHPGHGHVREWTRGGSVNRLAAEISARYQRVNVGRERQGLAPLPLPQLVIRGHNHKPEDSYDNHPVRAIILPGWQLQTAFGERMGGGWLEVGSALVVCENGEYEVHKRYRVPPVRQPWDPKELEAYVE